MDLQVRETKPWQYVGLDRLTREQSARSGGYTQTFASDPADNLTTFKGAAQNFNVDNQRTGSGFGYDGNGNASTYQGQSLTFDPLNRLSTLSSNWSATYRADGLRASKTIGKKATYFLYDRGEPVLELNSAGNVTAINVFAPDGLVARQQNASWIYYVFDVQGNVAQRLDGNQNVLSNSCYDAFGVETSTGSPSDPFGYHARSGYYFDRENGLYLCQHRYYDPATGRWLNRDPIGYGGGIGLYAYCGNSPTMLTDRSGTGGIDEDGRDIEEELIEVVLARQAQRQRELLLEAEENAIPEDWGPPDASGTYHITRVLDLGPEGTPGVLENGTGLPEGGYPEDGWPGAGKDWPDSDVPPEDPCPNPAAEGPHSVLRTRSSRGGPPFTQGFTYDGNGTLIGRVDVTDHNRPWDHPDNPHWHEWPGPNGPWGGPAPLPWNQ